MSASFSSYAMEIAGTISVPRSTHKISTVVSGRRNLGGDVAQERRDFRNVGRKRVRDGLLEVVKDETTFFDTIHDGGEVVIHENHVSRFLGNILTGDTHGDTDVTLLERRGVVDAITGDGDNFAASLAVFDDQELVRRRHARPNDLLVIESRVPLGALSDRVFNFSPRANVVTLHDDGGPLSRFSWETMFTCLAMAAAVIG